MENKTEQKGIYKKLLSARTEFQKRKVNKSGQNDYQNFRYYELSDLVPTITDISNQEKIINTITFTKTNVKLVITDLETGEQLNFCTPFPPIALEGNSNKRVQEIGSMHTYFRRYLYLLAYDIVEPDTIDNKDTGEKRKPTKVETPKGTPTPAPIKRTRPKTAQQKQNAQKKIDPKTQEVINQKMAELTKKSSTTKELTKKQIASLKKAPGIGAAIEGLKNDEKKVTKKNIIQELSKLAEAEILSPQNIKNAKKQVMEV